MHDVGYYCCLQIETSNYWLALAVCIVTEIDKYIQTQIPTFNTLYKSKETNYPNKLSIIPDGRFQLDQFIAQ